MASHVQCKGKKVFRTPKDAEYALNTIWKAALRGRYKNKDGQPMPCRVYKCAECKYWHLTSLARKSKAERLAEKYNKI